MFYTDKVLNSIEKDLFMLRFFLSIHLFFNFTYFGIRIQNNPIIAPRVIATSLIIFIKNCFILISKPYILKIVLFILMSQKYSMELNEILSILMYIRKQC